MAVDGAPTPAAPRHAGGMRLFAAVHPPAPVLAHLETALASVRGGEGRGLRWTPPEDRHITLAFYGEVPEGYLEDLAQALDDVAGGHPPFEASLRGAGLFDGRTLWVGCAGDGWGPLMASGGQVGMGLLGRAEDGRSRPHLTVARLGGRARGRRGDGRGGGRVAGPGGGRTLGGGQASARGTAGDPAALAHALALYTGPSWTVGEIALVSSRLGAGPSGTPRYDVVHRAVLVAG